jgi:hypothetical protein
MSRRPRREFGGITWSPSRFDAELQAPGATTALEDAPLEPGPLSSFGLRTGSVVAQASSSPARSLIRKSTSPVPREIRRGGSVRFGRVRR